MQREQQKIVWILQNNALEPLLVFIEKQVGKFSGNRINVTAWGSQIPERGGGNCHSSYIVKKALYFFLSKTIKIWQ